MSIRTLVICGDGAGAAILLQALCHKAGNSHLRIVIIGTGDALGAGVAYGTGNPNHLLNVPAGRMSADPTEPSQFLDWLAAQGIDAHSWPHCFTARKHYASYLAEGVEAATVGRKRIEIHKGEVKTLIRDHNAWVVSHTAGPPIMADLVVLATGNDRPSPIADKYDADVGRTIIDNPWAELDVGPDEDVLLLGSGLTAVDAVISLLDKGHRAKISLLSRHGLLPAAHVEPDGIAPPTLPYAATARSTLAALRAAIGKDPSTARTQGVMDSLRQQWPHLWQSFSEAEKLRFLRHGLTYWNVHRHRIAPQVAARVRSHPKLDLIRGRLKALTADNGGLTATIMRRGIESRLTVGKLINCTGPNADPAKSHDRLIENIITSRIARPARVPVGLDVDDKNRVRDIHGQPHLSLFALGTLTRPQWWEITAIPEISRQAYAVAGYAREQLGVQDSAARVNAQY
jgi:uncharacterized NAD(P)/FAD-binding protein YdhS